MISDQDRYNFRELFIECFSPMKDPGRTSKGNLKYPLDEILFMVLSAVVSGATDWTAISDFGRCQGEWLKKYFPYANGTCSHDVLGRLFGAIDSKSFESCFAKWAETLAKLLPGEIVAIDGKTLRGSCDTFSQKAAVHMVSAFASGNGIGLGQVATEEKSNEIMAIPKLLGALSISGCTVTIGAMGCQRQIAGAIRERGAHYLLATKGNQQELREQVEKIFRISSSIETHVEEGTGHGRVERRACHVVKDLKFLDGREDWKGLTSIAKVESERYDKLTGKRSRQARYYISSLTAGAAQVNNAVRSHWSVENGLHWQLDVLFGEDRSRKRMGNSAHNFNLELKIALGMLERDGTPKMQRKENATVPLCCPNTERN